MGKKYFDINALNNIADKYGLWHRTTKMGNEGNVEEYFMPENTVRDLVECAVDFWRQPLFAVKHHNQDPSIYTYKNLNFRNLYDENEHSIDYGESVLAYSLDELEKYVKRVFAYLKEYQLLQKRLNELDKLIELEEDFK